MRYIAHRANLDGPSSNENTIEAIYQCFEKDVEVEVDVWFSNGSLFLGHDYPKFPIELHDLINQRIWCHAKSPETFAYLQTFGDINTFFQQDDDVALTTFGYLWCHSKSFIKHPKAVLTILDVHTQEVPDGTTNLCTDYPLVARQYYGATKYVTRPPKLVVLDVDGVLTNGTKLYDRQGNILSKQFCDSDFTAIKRFQSAGVPVVLLSGDPIINTSVAQTRGLDIYINRVNGKIVDKTETLAKITKDFSVDLEDVIYVGDDYYDILAMEVVGHAYCPQNAISDVKNISKVLPSNGGEGVVAALYEELREHLDDAYPTDDVDKNPK